MKTGGLKLYNGLPIIQRFPPCQNDDTACEKVRPGHSDLTEHNRRLVTFFDRCRVLGKWPEDDPDFDNYRYILTRLWNQVEDGRKRKDTMEDLEWTVTKIVRAMRP